MRFFCNILGKNKREMRIVTHDMETQFLPLRSGNDESVRKWFKHFANRKMMQDAQIDLSKNVRAEQNRIRRSK